MSAKNSKKDGDEKEKRGRRGEGTIYWDKTKKQYCGALSLGYLPNGKRNRPRVYGDTMAEVRDGLKKKREEFDDGIDSSNKYTVEQAVNDWLERGLKTQGESTKERLRSDAVNHVIPGLGRAKLKKLTPDQVDDWLMSLRGQLSTDSLKKCLSVLRRSIRMAERRNKIGRNVAELVEAPTGRKGRPSKSMTFEEAAKIMEASKSTEAGKGSWIHAYLVLSLLTGVRTEEARALRWRNVHLETKDGISPHVEVWRSVRKGGDTKTQKSRRTIALPPVVVTVLKEWQGLQRKERQENGDKYRDITFVFGTRSDREKEAGAVRVSLKYVLKKAGMDEHWVPRELRHTFVSLMSAHGATDELIADLVGHKQTSTTRSVYRHQLRPVITEGADIIARIFQQGGPDSKG